MQCKILTDLGKSRLATPLAALAQTFDEPITDPPQFLPANDDQTPECANKPASRFSETLEDAGKMPLPQRGCKDSEGEVQPLILTSKVEYLFVFASLVAQHTVLQNKFAETWTLFDGHVHS